MIDLNVLLSDACNVPCPKLQDGGWATENTNGGCS